MDYIKKTIWGPDPKEQVCSYEPMRIHVTPRNKARLVAGSWPARGRLVAGARFLPHCYTNQR